MWIMVSTILLTTDLMISCFKIKRRIQVNANGWNIEVLELYQNFFSSCYPQHTELGILSLCLSYMRTYDPCHYGVCQTESALHSLPYVVCPT